MALPSSPGPLSRKRWSLEHLEARCVLSAGPLSAPMFQLRLDVVDLDGNPIQQVQAGTEFEVRMLASDLRDGAVAKGLFAAFADIVYRSDLLKLADGDQDGPAQFGKEYANVRRGDFSRPGVVNEFGAVAGMTPVGGDELLVGSVRFVAQASGTARFGLDPCEDVVQHQLLAYGFGQGVTDVTRHLGTSLQVLGPHGEFAPDDGWIPFEDRNLRGIPPADVHSAASIQPVPFVDINDDLRAPRKDRITRLPALVFDSDGS